MRQPARQRFLILLVILCLTLGLPIGTDRPAYAGSDIQLVVNGQFLHPDVAPVIVQGQVLAPLRAVIEALGGRLAWDGPRRRVTGEWNGNQITLTIGSDQGSANGRPVTLAVPAMIVDGRTMVTRNFLSESLGAAVSWNRTTGTVAVSLPEPGQTLRLGLIAPMGGDLQASGQAVANGFRLYLDDHQRQIGGFQVKLLIGNDVNTATDATKLATAMITQGQVSAIVGSVTSLCSIPISEVCQHYRVPMITPTASSPGVTTRDGTRKDYAFRAVNLEPYQGAAMAEFARQRLHAKTAAVLVDQDNDYSVGLKDAFDLAFTGGGGQTPDTVPYTANDTDFSAILTKIAYEKPDVLYLPDYCQPVGVIARQARLLGIKAVFLGGDG